MTTSNFSFPMADRFAARNDLAHPTVMPDPSPVFMRSLPWAEVSPVIPAPQMLQTDASLVLQMGAFSAQAERSSICASSVSFTHFFREALRRAVTLDA